MRAATGTSRCYSFASFSVHITSSPIGFLGNNSSIIKGKKKVNVELFPVLAQDCFSIFFSLLSSASHLFQWKQNFFFSFFFACPFSLPPTHHDSFQGSDSCCFASTGLQSLDRPLMSVSSRKALFFHGDPSARRARLLENISPLNKNAAIW